jgi:hypothetical protein
MLKKPLLSINKDSKALISISYYNLTEIAKKSGNSYMPEDHPQKVSQRIIHLKDQQ